MQPQTNKPRDRFDCEGDEIARHLFSEDDLRMSPDEYAARNAQNILLFSADRYRYHDATLGAWVRRLGEIIRNTEELERCRRQFLTPEEYATVKRREAEEF